MKTILNKLFAVLCSIGADKYQHFTFGALTAFLTALATCWLPWWIMLIIAELAVITVAIGKELYDDSIDWKDIAATLLGGIPIIVMLLF